MAEIIFIYEGQNITIQCNKEEKLRYICNNFSQKINIDLNSLLFLYGGNKLNLDNKLNDVTKENKINIIVYKNEDEICPNCGRIINNKIINEIETVNNNINDRLNGLKSYIDFIMNDIMIKNNINFNNINYITNQLKNINTIIISIINEDIKKINNKINQIKLNNANNILNDISDKNNSSNVLTSINEITCIYYKMYDEIDLLHNFDLKTNSWEKECKKLYIEGKNNINKKNIDIYINDKKIPFTYKYKSDEKGTIKVKFIFNKLLTSTNSMFYECCTMKSIDLSSFNATKVKNMSHMFDGCSSLKSIDLSSFNTSNVNDMSFMFDGCSSLKSIDLSSFDTSNVNNMKFMLFECNSLEKNNIKISNSGRKIVNEFMNQKIINV